MPNLFLFTTGSDLGLLQQSCDRNHITLHGYESDFKGYVTTKVREAVRYLSAALTYATEEAVMWVDGHDSLIVKPEATIMARWVAMGMPLLIAAERNCWPDPFQSNRYPEAPCPRYLNAGGWIGTKPDVMQALHMVERHAVDEDDQRTWTNLYLAKMLPNCQIDHARQIFASVGDGPEALESDSCVKHFNSRVPGREEYWNAVVKGGQK